MPQSGAWAGGPKQGGHDVFPSVPVSGMFEPRGGVLGHYTVTGLVLAPGPGLMLLILPLLWAQTVGELAGNRKASHGLGANVPGMSSTFPGV